MRIMIAGAGGMLGQDVRQAVLDAGHQDVALVRAELDITDARMVADAVADACPDVVVNCAAWTDVDGAEADPEGAMLVNGRGAGNLARAAAAAGAWTIHVSSDYVFNGRKRMPYVESDAVEPICAYGWSKLEGEREVARAAPGRHTIVRSSWLFGARGKCFPRTILQRAAERDHLDVVCDQIGTPTFTGHLAGALVKLAGALGGTAGAAGSELRSRGDAARPSILHIAGAGHCSWFEFAQEIVATAGLDCQVRPVGTERYPRPAARPLYSVLGSELGMPGLPHWTEGLTEFMSQTARATA